MKGRYLNIARDQLIDMANEIMTELSDTQPNRFDALDDYRDDFARDFLGKVDKARWALLDLKAVLDY